MAEIRVPQPARPFGVTAISILLAVSAVALLVLTLLHHVGALAGLLRLVAVLTFVLIAIGLWKVHNNARVFLFFLLVSDVLGCLMALFLYALRQSHYRLAVFLVLQILYSGGHCLVPAITRRKAGLRRAESLAHDREDAGSYHLYRPAGLPVLLDGDCHVQAERGFVRDGEQSLHLQPAADAREPEAALPGDGIRSLAGEYGAGGSACGRHHAVVVIAGGLRAGAPYRSLGRENRASRFF